MTKNKKNTDAIAIQAYNLCDGTFTIPEQKIYNGGDFVFTLQGHKYEIQINLIHLDSINEITTLEFKNNKITMKLCSNIQTNIAIRGIDFFYNFVRMQIVGDKIISDDNELNTHSITFEEHSFLLDNEECDHHNIINFNNSKIEVSWIEFFSNGAFKRIRSVKSQKINASYNGQMYYDLPIKENEVIYFTANGEIKSISVEDSPERSAIVYAERLNKLEKSQEKTNQEVEKMKNNQTMATREDRWFVFVCVAISIGLLCFAYLYEPMIGDPVSFVRKNPDINKYVFLFEILKRTPIIVLFLLAFKFLQLAFERIRLIGEVEKVQKYLKLAQGDNVKNNLLGIIAVPFFTTHKKQKQPLLERLVDKSS